MVEKKTSEAQRRASKEWKKRNPEHARYLSVRSSARTFSRKYAKNWEEVEELLTIFDTENINKQN